MVRRGPSSRAVYAVFFALAVTAVIAASIVQGSPAGRAALGPGQASFTITAPAASQPLNSAFSVTTSLNAFTPDLSSTWGGYDFELAYDTTLLSVDGEARGLCSAAGWGVVTTTPHLVTGCAFQSTSATGVIETTTFRCLAAGTSQLTLLPRNDPRVKRVGTALFDEDGADFTMTFVNTSVTCGAATSPTATPSPVPNTNTPTATLTATNTATNTATPTPSATATLSPTATVTSVPTATPIGGAGCTNDTDCDGCPDLGELRLTPPTNPANPWDFYSVPLPALYAMQNASGVLRDNAVTPADAQAVFAYFGKDARIGTTEYEQDRNGNGIKDGLEYDRSSSGPGRSGPPDGAVTAQDAQIAFAQFRMNYSC